MKTASDYYDVAGQCRLEADREASGDHPHSLDLTFHYAYQFERWLSLATKARLAGL